MIDTRHPMSLIALSLITLWLGGCGKTLVFGERSGVNIAIRVDTDRPPPVAVNIGLDRLVGTIVPPTRYGAGNEPSGDAASMLSGFQVESFEEPIAFKPTTAAANGPFNIDVVIGTQFASGAAAVTIAKGNPKVVAAITSLGSFADVQPRSESDRAIAREISHGITKLGNDGRRCFATRLKLTVPVASDNPANEKINDMLRDELDRRRSAQQLNDMKAIMAGVKGAC